MTESERLIDRLFIAAEQARQNGIESRLLRVAGSLMKLLDEAVIRLAERDGENQNLAAENAELRKDKARLDWIDRERDERSRASITSQLDHHLVQGWKVREAIDATAGYWEPEFINWYEETSSNG
mgnify:FL=1